MKVEENNFSIRLNKQDVSKILLFLIIWEIILVLVHLMVTLIAPNINWGPLNLLFNLDSEAGIPTWFSSLQLFTAAVIILIISRWTKKYKWFFLLGAVILAFLSFDEGSGLHERITAYTVEYNIDILRLFMIGNHGAWIIPYVLLGLLIIFISIRPIIWIYRNNTKPFFYILYGVLVVIVGFIGIELLGYIILPEGGEMLNSILVAVEEFFEMLGVSIALSGIILLGIEIQSQKISSDNVN